jgi:uncharacterized delta-60 repeat protein
MGNTVLVASRLGGGGSTVRRTILRAAGALCALGAGAGVAVALASPGNLDPSFGTNGTTVIERPTDTYPVDGALSPGGRIVVLSTPEPGKIVVQRLLSNGSPDPTFDGNGEAVIEPEGFPGAFGLAVQPNGDIVVVGYRNVEGGEAAEVWRLKAEGGSSAPNGDLDPMFGTGGRVDLLTGQYNFANAVAVQPDGKIVVAGYLQNPPAEREAAVWRLTRDGGLDAGFNSTGVRAISDTKEDVANAVAVAPDGKIVLAGTTRLSSAPPDAVVWRVDPEGAIDKGFDTDGQADIDTGGEDAATAVAVQPDEKIVLAGWSQKSGEPRLGMVWRMTAAGGGGLTNAALDPTFGHEGTAVLSGLGNAEVTAVALQADGKVLVTGSTHAGIGPPYVATLWRLNPEGGTAAPNSQLDPSFGSGGTSTVAEGEGAFADSVSLGADRRIVATGSTYSDHILVFRALGDPFTLRVAKSGTGAGTVTSSPGGIGCGASCAAEFDDGSPVALTASPATGSQFAGWSGGGCSGASTCTVTMSSEQSVTATFDTVPPKPTSQNTGKPSLGTAHLHFGKLRRSARHFVVTVSGLRTGAHVTGVLRAAGKVLARAKATVTRKGTAVLNFTFGRAALHRLHAHSLRRLQLRVSASLGALRAATVTKTVKLVG